MVYRVCREAAIDPARLARSPAGGEAHDPDKVWSREKLAESAWRASWESPVPARLTWQSIHPEAQARYRRIADAVAVAIAPPPSPDVAGLAKKIARAFHDSCGEECEEIDRRARELYGEDWGPEESLMSRAEALGLAQVEWLSRELVRAGLGARHSIVDRIEWAKDRLAAAERDGDGKAAQAWHGYIQALWWCREFAAIGPEGDTGAREAAREHSELLRRIEAKAKPVVPAAIVQCVTGEFHTFDQDGDARDFVDARFKAGLPVYGIMTIQHWTHHPAAGPGAAQGVAAMGDRGSGRRHEHAVLPRDVRPGDLADLALLDHVADAGEHQPGVARRGADGLLPPDGAGQPDPPPGLVADRGQHRDAFLGE